MQLFWGDGNGSQMILQGDEARHCTKVLRKQIGDTIEVINGSGNLFKCAIVGITKREVLAQVTAQVPHFGQLPYTLHLAVAPTKNTDRFEWLLEKATEMGITSITPLLTAHVERTRLREERLQRILIAAAKQSYKGTIPELRPATTFKSFVEAANSDQKFIAHCYDLPRKALSTALIQHKSLTICIGPEGDFSPDEVDLATAKGFAPVHLGDSRLRTETAGIVAVAAVYSFYAAFKTP